MSQNGKGSKMRPHNKKIYDENFSQINWHKNESSLDKLKYKDDNGDMLNLTWKISPNL
ncbi:MAG: hypothetical protein Q7R95_10560 [bacterium]|nr:hypothetical protein [bacterium]